jgi:hypothetical protein
MARWIQETAAGGLNPFRIQAVYWASSKAAQPLAAIISCCVTALLAHLSSLHCQMLILKKNVGRISICSLFFPSKFCSSVFEVRNSSCWDIVNL